MGANRRGRVTRLANVIVCSVVNLQCMNKKSICCPIVLSIRDVRVRGNESYLHWSDSTGHHEPRERPVERMRTFVDRGDRNLNRSSSRQDCGGVEVELRTNKESSTLSLRGPPGAPKPRKDMPLAKQDCAAGLIPEFTVLLMASELSPTRRATTQPMISPSSPPSEYGPGNILPNLASPTRTRPPLPGVGQPPPPSLGLRRRLMRYSRLVGQSDRN
jgi:hypothetical protein